MTNTNNNSIFENAWLNLGDLNEIILPDNPLFGRSKQDLENPDLHLLRLLASPRYFGTTVKLLFGIELHPIQVALMQEFWSRPFPMFIA
jgi:hypothetical protein